MGLDMYLYLEKYESEYTVPEKEREEWKKNFFPPEMEKLGEKLKARDRLVKETNYQVAYWRKANAIHEWFIKNCADGEDDCFRVWVSEEKLEKLLVICSEVLADHSKAPELLPTKSGFFFGSTDYDEWYFADVEETVMLDPVVEFLTEMKRKKKGEYCYEIFYQASW